MLFSLFLSGGFQSVFGKPLTEADIRGAKKIAVMFGSFDPFNDGHFGTAEAAVLESGMDFTIVAPLNNPLKKPLPVATRLAMIDLAASESAHVRYPKSNDLYDSFLKDGLGTWIKKIRAINPQIEIHAVIGSDVSASFLRTMFINAKIHPQGWLISARAVGDQVPINSLVADRPYQVIQSAPRGKSSTKVKEFLSSNPTLYTDPHPLNVQWVPDLHPKVAEYILENRLYEGVAVGRALNPMTCLRNLLNLLIRAH